MTDRDQPTELPAAEAVHVLDLLAGHGVPVWLDGGWAVDACLGHQTRAHSDLDVLIEERNLPTALEALAERGYHPASRQDSTAWNFVVADEHGHQIDVDVINFDIAGNGVWGPASNGQAYPAEAFTGTGTIGTHPVSCFSPHWLVTFHTGYDVDANDWADVSALCHRFGIPVPPDYARFQKASPSSTGVPVSTGHRANRSASPRQRPGVRPGGPARAEPGR